MTEMHDVVEMLLNRMKDYPEDFVRTPAQGFNAYRSDTKWERALGMVYEVAAPHEKDALDIRGEEAKRAVYMGAALQTILSDDEPVDVKKVFKTGSQLGFGSAPVKSEGGMIGYNTISNSINIGGAQIRNEYQKAYATNND